MLFHAYYPARGRKRAEILDRLGFQTQDFHAYYPARGRKLKGGKGGKSIACVAFTPITPQGDGNRISTHIGWYKQIHLSRLLPRKGTETPQVAFETGWPQQSLSRLLPRKGTETVRKRKKKEDKEWRKNEIEKAIMLGWNYFPCLSSIFDFRSSAFRLTFMPTTPQGDGNGTERWKREDRRGKKMWRNEKDTKL